MPRPGNAGWAGTSDGVAARGFVNGEGPTAQRWEGKHRRCAPVRSPCPQAESDAGALSCLQAVSTQLTSLPAGSLDSGTPALTAGKLGLGLCSDQPLLGVGVDRCLDYFKFREGFFE